MSGRFKFGIIGNDALGIRPDHDCSEGIGTENDAFSVDVFPGATATAELCWTVEGTPLEKASSIVFYANAFNRGSGQKYYYVDLLAEVPPATPHATPQATPR